MEERVVFVGNPSRKVMISVGSGAEKCSTKSAPCGNWEYCVINLSTLSSMRGVNCSIRRTVNSFVTIRRQAIMLGIVEAKKRPVRLVRDHAPFKYVRKPSRFGSQLNCGLLSTARMSSNLVRRYG